MRGRRPLLPSELGDLQAFGVKDKDLNTIERSFNAKKKVEIDEVKTGSRPTAFIYIDGEEFLKLEGY